MSPFLQSRDVHFWGDINTSSSRRACGKVGSGFLSTFPQARYLTSSGGTNGFMLRVLLDWFSTNPVAIGTPGVIFGRLVMFLEFGIDGFTGNHFSLALLFMEDRIIQGTTFVEDGDFALGVFTHSDLRLAHGITRT